jgi:hypothetical protein
MSLCTAYQEDLIANEFLRVGPNCANVSCQFPITSHSHRQTQQGNYLHPVYFIEPFPSHILHICILFAFGEFCLMRYFYGCQFI